MSLAIGELLSNLFLAQKGRKRSTVHVEASGKYCWKYNVCREKLILHPTYFKVTQ